MHTIKRSLMLFVLSFIAIWSPVEAPKGRSPIPMLGASSDAPETPQQSSSRAYQAAAAAAAAAAIAAGALVVNNGTPDIMAHLTLYGWMDTCEALP